MTYRVHLAADFQKSVRVSPRLSPVPSNGANHLPWLTFPTTGGENNSPLAPEGTNAGEPPTVLLPGIPKTGHRVLPALSARNPCTKVGTPENIPAIRGLVSVKEKLFILYRDLHPPESFCSVYRIGTRKGCHRLPGFDHKKHTRGFAPPRPPCGRIIELNKRLQKKARGAAGRAVGIRIDDD